MENLDIIAASKDNDDKIIIRDMWSTLKTPRNSI
jgi:hypothetical protein